MPLPALVKRLNTEPSASVPVPSSDAIINTPGDTALYWTYVYKETFIKGAAIFEYKKERYAIKPMFRKGYYDQDKGSYISIPAVYIVNVTNADKEIELEAWMDISLLIDYPLTTLSGDKIKIKNDSETLSIFSQGGFFEKTVFSIRHDQLFKLWADNAEYYKRTVHGKTIYFVPQMNQAKGGIIQIGFVLSDSKPFADATGRPLDFIALCQAQNGVTCRPIRYSIPLGLKFRYLGKEGTNNDKDFFYWQIEEMVNEDLYDALDDEALQTSTNP